MTRLPDWEKNLRRLILLWELRAFAWGTADCACFAADAVKCITGIDVSAPLGAYRTATEAECVLDGFGGLTAAVDEIIGNRQDIIAVRRGDLVQLTDAAGGALAVSTGLAAHALTDRGLRAFPMRFHRFSWKIG